MLSLSHLSSTVFFSPQSIYDLRSPMTHLLSIFHLLYSLFFLSLSSIFCLQSSVVYCLSSNFYPLFCLVSPISIFYLFPSFTIHTLSSTIFDLLSSILHAYLLPSPARQPVSPAQPNPAQPTQPAQLSSAQPAQPRTAQPSPAQPDQPSQSNPENHMF